MKKFVVPEIFAFFKKILAFQKFYFFAKNKSAENYDFYGK
jgi:hypothetical protein